MIERITVEIIEFIIDNFANEKDFNHLCRKLGIKNIFAGNYDDRVTSLIKRLESDYPDPVRLLYNALIAIKTQLSEIIDSLFEINHSSLEKKREIVAVLFSDIKGYSKITEDHLKEKLKEISLEFSQKFEKDDELIFLNTWGDAFYIIYRSPSKLLERAIELRDFFINADWKGMGYDNELQIRIGINALEATIFYKNGKAIDGIGIKIDETARIEPIVEPNNIYCSSTFYNIVQEHTSVEFEPLGMRNLAKDFKEMELYSIQKKNK